MTSFSPLSLVSALGLAITCAAGPATAQTVEFGDDSGQWANDGECDDRRFVGSGMAAGLSWQYTGKDASDCRALFDSGAIRLWDWTLARQATQCGQIDFGDDGGDYAADGECDDIRFEGLGMASGVGPDQVRRDATDCRHYCEMGIIALRDYFE